MVFYLSLSFQLFEFLLKLPDSFFLLIILFENCFHSLLKSCDIIVMMIMVVSLFNIMTQISGSGAHTSSSNAFVNVLSQNFYCFGIICKKNFDCSSLKFLNFDFFFVQSFEKEVIDSFEIIIIVTFQKIHFSDEESLTSSKCSISEA